MWIVNYGEFSPNYGLSIWIRDKDRLTFSRRCPLRKDKDEIEVFSTTMATSFSWKFECH